MCQCPSDDEIDLEFKTEQNELVLFIVISLTVFHDSKHAKTCPSTLFDEIILLKLNEEPSKYNPW